LSEPELILLLLKQLA